MRFLGRGAVLAGLCGVMGWGLGAPAALAAPLADLSVAKVSMSRTAAPPGGRVVVSVVVANRGAAARPSAVTWLLSADRRRDRRDRRIAQRSRTGALRAGGRARLRARMRVPRGMRPGRYRMLACADGAGKLRERSERNNCRATSATVFVLGASRADMPPFRPRPLNVRPTLDAARAVTQTVGRDGATLTTTGADGTSYTLSLPAGAVPDPVDITMTPVASIAGLPFRGLGGGVQLEPDGIALLAPGRLTIKPPAPAPAAGRAAFSYAGAGRDLHLQPSSSAPGTVEFDLEHFSAYGWGKATAADRAAQAARVPSTREAWALQNVARAWQEAKLSRGEDRARWHAAGLTQLFVWGNEGVRAALTAALTNDAAFDAAGRELLSWERQRTLVDSEELLDLRAELEALFDRAFAFALARASERCVQNKDPFQARRMLAFERQRQFMGEDPDPAVFERIARCTRFELQVDFRFAFDFDDGPLRTGVDEGRLTFALEPSPDASGLPAYGAPTAVPELTSASWGPPADGASWAWTGTDVTRPAAVRRFVVDFPVTPVGADPLPAKIDLGLDWADLVERGVMTVCDDSGCSSSDAGSPGTHSLAMLSLYVAEAGKDGQTVIRDWTIEPGVGNEVFATKDRERSRTVQGGTGHELLHLRLVHRPLA